MAQVHELDERTNDKIRAIRAEKQVARNKLQSLHNEETKVLQDFIDKEELDISDTQISVEERQDGKRVLIVQEEE